MLVSEINGKTSINFKSSGIGNHIKKHCIKFPKQLSSHFTSHLSPLSSPALVNIIHSKNGKQLGQHFPSSVSNIDPSASASI